MNVLLNCMVMIMKVEKISLTLEHYVDSDYSCEHSKLEIQTQDIRGCRRKYVVRGIEAEALFSIVRDIIKPKEDKKDEDRVAK